MPIQLEHAFNLLAPIAWKARESAFIIGNTAVGCALMTDRGTIFSGCNVEHRFRCHDVHAEINALTSMVTSGERRIQTILVVAERTRFMPCGGCMDWIMQFGGSETLVAFQNHIGGEFTVQTAAELMPYYPE
jgi:cytidine deaminase